MIPDLQVGAGTAFGPVGKNGAGKTTFLRLVLDLIRADEIRADEGAVQLNGEVLSHSLRKYSSPSRARLGEDSVRNPIRLDLSLPSENHRPLGCFVSF